MEKKINIAELLKDCPQGMELDCTIFDDVYFDYIDDVSDIINCYIQDSTKKIGISFSKYGCYSSISKSKCVIFPKGKTTWEGFKRPFKDGDIVATSNGLRIGITTGGEINSFIPTYCVIRHDGEFEAYLDKKETWQFNRLATEEEKQKLFQAIKDNGYKWDTKTKTLEKLIEPVFKVGNRITKRGSIENSWIVSSVSSEYYGLQLPNDNDHIGVLPVCEQDKWELVPNKFDINTLKPFESRVLVRSSYGDIWRPAIYGVFDSKKHYHYVVGGNYWTQCIPYEGNEHLLETTNDCDEFYKTWD